MIVTDKLLLSVLDSAKLENRVNKYDFKSGTYNKYDFIINLNSKSYVCTSYASNFPNSDNQILTEPYDSALNKGDILCIIFSDKVVVENEKIDRIYFINSNNENVGIVLCKELPLVPFE